MFPMAEAIIGQSPQLFNSISDKIWKMLTLPSRTEAGRRHKGSSNRNGAVAGVVGRLLPNNMDPRYSAPGHYSRGPEYWTQNMEGAGPHITIVGRGWQNPADSDARTIARRSRMTQVQRAALTMTNVRGACGREEGRRGAGTFDMNPESKRYCHSDRMHQHIHRTHKWRGDATTSCRFRDATVYGPLVYIRGISIIRARYI
jgi:hypothetical protein